MIKIRNLYKKYENNYLLKNISFDIFDGKILAIIGESGSGKTTLASILVGISQKNSGIIKINEKNIEDYTKKELSKEITIIFQEYSSSLNPNLTIREVLNEVFIINNEKINIEKINFILKIVNLNNINIDENCNILSGGEKQRLVIARALLLDSKTLIFDEAISSLDIHISLQIIKMIKEINEKLNKTIIFITHDISFLRLLTEDILVLKNGEILERGNIFKESKSEWIEKLLKIEKST